MVYLFVYALAGFTAGSIFGALLVYHEAKEKIEMLQRARGFSDYLSNQN